MWITSGSIADVAVIWAKVDDEEGKVRGFLVETNRPGFSAYDVHGKWSLRASVTSGLSLQDVRIPACNLLPGSGGLKSPLMCLNQARYGISWGALGAAMSCYDTALQYSLLRKQFREEPIASHQLVQEKLTWMISEITKGQLLALQVGRLKDAGKVGFEHISMAKRNNVWMALECARMARDILGGNGITDDYPVMRHMMNLESVKTYEGTHDIHALIIGQSITGYPCVLAFSTLEFSAVTEHWVESHQGCSRLQPFPRPFRNLWLQIASLMSRSRTIRAVQVRANGCKVRVTKSTAAGQDTAPSRAGRPARTFSGLDDADPPAYASQRAGESTLWFCFIG